MLRENKFGFIKFYTEKDNKHFGFITEKDTKISFYFKDSDLLNGYIPGTGDYVKFVKLAEAHGTKESRAGFVELARKDSPQSQNYNSNPTYSKPSYSAQNKHFSNLPPACPNCGARKGVRYGWTDSFGVKRNVCKVCGKEFVYGDSQKSNKAIYWKVLLIIVAIAILIFALNK